ncbi:hypothetical protein [Athalassotoga sp.]
MREGQITLLVIVLLLITVEIVVNIYFQIQTNQMDIQRMNIHNLIQMHSR